MRQVAYFVHESVGKKMLIRHVKTCLREALVRNSSGPDPLLKLI